MLMQNIRHQLVHNAMTLDGKVHQIERQVKAGAVPYRPLAEMVGCVSKGNTLSLKKSLTIRCGSNARGPSPTNY
jgi:hypothetical protein